MKKIVRLTESDLHRIVKESVRRILREDDYRLPTGGMDVLAYDYDQALENAESLEDWDRMMAGREKHSNNAANVALGYHPQYVNKWGPGSVGASKYVNPRRFSLNNDKVLDDLEYNANSGIEQHGFPT